MIPEHEEAVSYCRLVLLPIRERRTDGNLAIIRRLSSPAPIDSDLLNAQDFTDNDYRLPYCSCHFEEYTNRFSRLTQLFSMPADLATTRADW